MRANGSKSNQDSGSLDKIVSELLAVLAAEEAGPGLSRLAEKLGVSGPVIPNHGLSRVEGSGLAVQAGCSMPCAK
jgi:hypothetical protein